MKKYTLICIGSCLALALAAPAQAKTFNKATFLGIDRDADNQVSPKEAAIYRERYFSTIDLNGDGSVAFEEYVQANQLREATAEKGSPVKIPDDYKAADTNQDTILSREEFMEAGKAAFTALDKDGNGFVSREEFVAPGL